MAIALDATSSSENQTGTSVTFAHTCTGTNLILIVGISAAIEGASKLVSTLTYNGVALTRMASLEEIANQNRCVELWYLIAPATGANNIVVTYTTAPDFYYNVSAASYTGVSQDSQPDVFGTSTSGATTVLASNKTLITTQNNCWLVAVSCNGTGFGSASTADSGSVLRLQVYNRFMSGYELTYLDSNGAKSPAGSYSIGYTWTSESRQIMIAAAIAPVATATFLSKITII